MTTPDPPRPEDRAVAEPTAAEPTDDAPDRTVRRRRLAGLLPVLALALLAALLLLSGWFTWQVLQDRRADTARQDGLAAARDAARLLFSYDHSRLEDDFEAGLAVTTGDFREEYERTTREVVQPVAEQYDASVEAVVVEAGVVEADPDRVVAVVFLNQTTTSTRVEGPKIDQSRVRMVLRDVDGRWLVERVNAL
jgi:Mce-associated membrane protein